MEPGQLFIERRILESSATEMLNYRAHEPLVYRMVCQFEPASGHKQLVLNEVPSAIRKRLDCLLEFCENNPGTSFVADSVLDGVSYTVRYSRKTWHLFCPDLAEMADVKRVGELLDALFDELEKQRAEC